MGNFSHYKHCTGNSYQSWTHQFIISGTCGKNCFYQPKGLILFWDWYRAFWIRIWVVAMPNFERYWLHSKFIPTRNFREFLLFHGITSETIHYVYFNKSFKGHQQTDKYTAIPASWDPPTAVCDRKKKKWNFKDKCNCMNLCSKGDPGLPPPPVRKYITLITSLSIESSNMSHESYMTHNK